MIIPIIIILTVILILLLIDWQKILKRLPQREKKASTHPQPVRTMGAPQRAKPHQGAARSVVNEMFEEPVREEVPQQPVLSEEVQDLLNQADIHYRKGEYKAAEQLYLQVASKDSKCSKAYSRLGVIYLENGEDYQDAEEAFRQALKGDAHNGYVLNNLGLVLYHQDKYADAIRHFEMAVRQDDGNANRHANLGKAYMAMRQYAKAESAFKRALKLAPNELEYKDLLGEAVEKKQAHKAMIRQ